MQFMKTTYLLINKPLKIIWIHVFPSRLLWAQSWWLWQLCFEYGSLVFWQRDWNEVLNLFHSFTWQCSELFWRVVHRARFYVILIRLIILGVIFSPFLPTTNKLRLHDYDKCNVSPLKWRYTSYRLKKSYSTFSSFYI